MSKESKGPFLTMAFFCEKALQEGDAVFSAIRIINQVLVEQHDDGPDLPPKYLMDLWMFVGFSSEAYEARRGLHITVTSPSGKEVRIPEKGAQVIFFPKEEYGSTTRIQLRLGVEELGMFWFRIYLDNELMGQTPFIIKYRRTQTEKGEN